MRFIGSNSVPMQLPIMLSKTFEFRKAPIGRSKRSSPTSSVQSRDTTFGVLSANVAALASLALSL